LKEFVDFVAIPEKVFNLIIEAGYECDAVIKKRIRELL
jgi:hypothetical protein